MASQRIVLTSPWKLGLFVFLLVVGTGFGLVYAYLELLGGEFDLSNENNLKMAYMILGGVAGLGLLGYLAVVTSARPMDRVVRGGKRREQLIKKFGRVDDPRAADLGEFDDEPSLVSVLERWAQDVTASSDAQMALNHQRQALGILASQVQVADGQGVSLDPEQSSPDLDPLVEAINRYVRETASAVEDRVSKSVPPVTNVIGPEVTQAVAQLDQQHTEMAGLVASISRYGDQLAHRPGDGAPSDDAARTALRSAGRLQQLRTQLEDLAEESNKLAITAALQISRLGDGGAELLQTAEELRSLSTRYQRLAGDLRLCETEQAETAERMHSGSGPTAPAADDELTMVFEQTTEALQEVLQRVSAPMAALRAASGAPAPTPQAAPAVAPAAPAAAAPAAAARAAPAPPVVEEAKAAASGERVYDMDELGGREISGAGAEAADEPIYELDQFGAVQL